MKYLNNFSIKKIIQEEFSLKLIIFGNFIFCIPNSIFALRGFFTRMRADDYCFSGLSRLYGLFGGLSFFYSEVSNRFSAYLLSFIFDFFGKNIGYFVPFVIIGLIVVLGLSTFKGRIFRGGFWFSILIAQIIIFFLFYTAPNLNQSVYWRSGMIHYFLPIIPFVYLIFLILNHSEKEFKNLVIILLVSFFSAGFSESYAALQTGTGLLIFIFSFFYTASSKNRIQKKTALLLLGSISAMIIMMVAPGNQLRLELLNQATDLFTLIVLSLQFALDFKIFSIRGYWLPFSILGVLATFLGTKTFQKPGIFLVSSKQALLVLITSILASFLLIVCIFTPTVYGMMAYPENRVLMLAQFILVVEVFTIGFLSGQYFQQTFTQGIPMRTAINIIFILLMLYPLRSVSYLIDEVKIASARATAWDKRDAQIKKQIYDGKKIIIIGGLDSFSEIAELIPNENYWVNKCASQYYAVESITTLE